MAKSVWIECPACGYRELLVRPLTACPRCRGEWLDARYDYQGLKDRLGELLLPSYEGDVALSGAAALRDDANKLTMGEGGTPLLRRQPGADAGLPHCT